ncbi:MAG: hypothetical protein WCR29_04745 [Bacteroidales bacterium]
MSNKTFLSQALKLLLLAFLSISFYSCGDKTDELTYYDTYIEGYIKDYHTGQPISGIVFDAYYVESSGSNFLSTYYELFTEIGKSDNNGYYKIRIPKCNNGVTFNSIKLVPHSTDDYFFLEKSFGYETNNLSKNSLTVNINPITYGYLKINVGLNNYINEPFAYESMGTYEEPKAYIPQRIIDSSISVNDKYYILKAGMGENVIYLYDGIHQYKIINAKDTVIINLIN